MMDTQDQNPLLERALGGDRQALEALLNDVQDLVFNLSLRMLGTVPDAEDAAQEILIRVMTRLSSFRGESAFATWVYRLAVNYLLDCKKGMFAQRPLDFDFYGRDILDPDALRAPDPVEEMDRTAMAAELKLSCTNVMLQCLDPESRVAFILGTMFRLDSRTAGQVLEMTPAAYRQRLSRARRKMAGFLASHCGLAGGPCDCARRVNHALAQGRLNPDCLDYQALKPLDEALLGRYCEQMEKLDALSATFEAMGAYRSPVAARQVLACAPLRAVKAYEKGANPDV